MDGSGLRQATRDDAPDTWPAWTPDVQSIVFGSLRGGSPAMWRIRLNGGEPERIGEGFPRRPLDPRGALAETGSRTSFALPVFSADWAPVLIPHAGNELRPAFFESADYANYLLYENDPGIAASHSFSNLFAQANVLASIS